MKYPKSYLRLGLLITTVVLVAANAGAWPVAPVPDASSTSLLLGLSVVGLTAIKRFVKR